jgi:hypothetical protein
MVGVRLWENLALFINDSFVKVTTVMAASVPQEGWFLVLSLAFSAR